MHNTVRRLIRITIACAVMATIAGAQQCSGCDRDNSPWEGTAGNDHLWHYTPGIGDADGVCDPVDCVWTGCQFNGVLKFTNRGAAAVQVNAPGGAPINVNPNKSHTFMINFMTSTVPCGQADEADPWYEAQPVGGGARLSGYIFSCEACNAIG